MQNNQNKVAVLYHKSCNDGVTAAAIAYAAMADMTHTKAVYAPINYNEPIPDIGEGNDFVFVLDFSLSMEELEKLADSPAMAKNGIIIILDHHDTAEKLYDHLPFRGNMRFKELTNGVTLSVFMDQKESGATLALKYFFKNNGQSFCVGGTEWALGQLVASYAKDRDLFLFSTERETRKFTHFCRLYNNDPIGLGKWLLQSDHEMFQQAIDVFDGMVEADMTRFRSLAEKANFGYIDGHVVALINCESTASSDVSKLIYDKWIGKVDYVMAFQMAPFKVFCSLRSHKDAIPVNDIAAKRKGGGHVHAAGMGMTVQEMADLLTDFNNQHQDKQSKIRLAHPELFEKQK